MQTHRPQASSFWFRRTEMGPGRGLSSVVPAAHQKRSLLAQHAGFQELQRRIGSLVTAPVFCAVCERSLSVCSSIALNRVSASFREPGLQSCRGDPFGPYGTEELISTCSRGRPLSLGAGCQTSTWPAQGPFLPGVCSCLYMGPS